MKVGRPRNIETPIKMWELFQGYQTDLKEREKEWEKVQYVGKDGARKTDKLKLPLTIEGFKRYCWDIEIGCIERYLKNVDNSFDDFVPICSRIKNAIRENQLTGGVLGVFNASITQRMNNLTERTDVTTDGKALKNEPITVNISQPLEDVD